MNSKVFLAITLATNLGLGAAWLRSPRPADPAPADTTDSATHRSPPAGSRAQPAPQIVTRQLESTFRWNEVESDDYHAYIANLRRIGCPEATIRDIILSDIDKLFAPRYAALRDPPRPHEFWRENYYYRPPSKEKQAQLAALGKEKQGLIQELLGVEERDLWNEFSGYHVPDEQRYAHLPADKRPAVKELEERFQKARAEVFEKSGGHVDAEAQKELNQLRQRMLAEMRQWLTPEQVFEHDVRTSDTARNLKMELRELDVSEDEFRALYQARLTQEELRYQDRSTPEAVKQSRELHAQAEESLKAALGAERYQEMQRAKDYAYRSLIAAAPHLGYDKAAADRVYEMKAEVEKAARELRSNPGMNPDQRNQALEAMRQATEQAIKQEIGERGYKNYRRQGGYWLDNIYRRPPPAAP